MQVEGGKVLVDLPPDLSDYAQTRAYVGYQARPAPAQRPRRALQVRWWCVRLKCKAHRSCRTTLTSLKTRRSEARAASCAVTARFDNTQAACETAS
jgi:hypothetical protein